MKKLHLLLLSLTLCLFSACHNDIWDAIDGLDGRVTKLEELCKEMNTNITSLQTIVDVLQSNDFITSIVEIKKDGKVVGYTITFGKHAPITIYHGQDGKDGADGKDGQDGADGKDGSTPVIGVAQDTDGVYYWTLNGEWLLDDNGNKLPVSGKDGKDGANGTDGKDGQDGADGKDGITPLLKIENGYWYISYDNGATWTQLGKATGEDGKDGVDGEDGKDGQNGADGKDGQDGDSMFQSVTQDDNYVYFTLADGTVIKIAKGNGNDQSNDDFIFTITYDANGGDGIMKKDTFYYGYPITIKSCAYTKEGYFCKSWNTNPNGSGAKYLQGFELTIDRNITLYAQWKESTWEAVDLGLSVKWASMNIGAESPEDYGFFFAWGEIEPKCIFSEFTYKWCISSVTDNLTKYNYRDYYGTTDGKTTLEAADDAATMNWGGNWRIPTRSEADELTKNCTWVLTSRNGVEGYEVTSKKNSNSIFLPLAGRYWNEEYSYEGDNGYFWLNSISINSNSLESDGRPYQAYCMKMTKKDQTPTYLLSRYIGLPVRPVCP
ncbi:MAG: InlB B-repeat-containing protein [Paludibacteraceae bacterium]|nr:InlB B-repeat-containing protein [Paludibacteraceae bacterium]